MRLLSRGTDMSRGGERVRQFCSLGLTLLVLGCGSNGSSPHEDKAASPETPSAEPGSGTTTGAAPEGEPPCADHPTSNRGGTGHRVYYYCINDLVGVKPTGRRPWTPRRLVAEYVGGPTQRQQARGLHGGLPQGTQFALHRQGNAYVLDLDRSSLGADYVLGHAFPIDPLVRRTLSQATGVERLQVLYDGRDVCQLVDEC